MQTPKKPDVVFVDTCIFEEYQYDFSNRIFSLLQDAIIKHKLTLILPKSIQDEFRRHIEQKSQEAASAIKAAQKKAPFVRAIKKWPLKNAKPESIKWELVSLYKKRLEKFLKDSKAQILGYENIDLDAVMSWYHQQIPPFGEGEKRKEFPDAFALASILLYAEKKDSLVAIVTQDKDWEKACSDKSSLVYNRSLSTFLESYEKPTDAKKLHFMIKKQKKLIDKEIEEKFVNCLFCVEEDWEGDVYDIDVQEITYFELQITGIGDREFLAAFQADINFFAHVTCDDYSTAIWDSEDKVAFAINKIDTNVSSSETVSGIIKLGISEDHKSIEKILMLEFDQDTFSVSINDAISDE
ncbi:MAG: DUF4935 domain-containing protein [Sedimentisphaerales bacterium]|nr:DUF4935 domain-containing protein [Sedimentisphaerales bacterium]